MRNFFCLASNVDVIPVLNALACNPDLWDQDTIRTTYPDTPHHVNDILLRFNHADVIDGHESVNLPAMFKLPQIRPILFDLMRRVEGERLGRVIITRLSPGEMISAHVDGGDHAAYFSRYHIVLQNNPGSAFFCGDEQVYMPSGSVWWFDNSKLHSVINNSIDDRITMIVDIKTFR